MNRTIETIETMEEKNARRREHVINTLVYLHIYDETDHRLFDLPITKLERQLKRFLAASHPHAGLGSLRL